MATTTPTNFRVRFPEFDEPTYPDERVQLFIDDATALVNPKCPNVDLMISYLTAHLLTMGTLTAHLLTMGTLTAGGNTSTFKGVASESVGDVSVSYSSGSGDAEDDFYKTSYGQRYLDLRKNCIGRPIVA